MSGYNICVIIYRINNFTIYLKLYYKLNSENMGEIVFNSECFNSDL